MDEHSLSEEDFRQFLDAAYNQGWQYGALLGGSPPPTEPPVTPNTNAPLGVCPLCNRPMDDHYWFANPKGPVCPTEKSKVGFRT